MKITITIDCEPEEARHFLGLPDVQSLNEAMIEQMKSRLEKGLSPEDMENLMKNWTTGAAMGLGEMQKGFWSLMQNMTQATGKK